MKRVIGWCCIFALIVSLAGCSNGSAREKTQIPHSQDTFEIGLSIDSLVIERWQRDRDVFLSTAKDLGAEVCVQDAGGDVMEQIEQIRYLKERKVKALAVIANDCYSLSSVIQEVKDAGIPVICYDRLIQNADVDLFLSVDSRKVGELMAQALLEQVPSGGNLLCVFGSPSDYNTQMMEEGFMAQVDGQGRNIVEKQYAKNWVAEEAYDAVNRQLMQDVRLDGVMCGNDDLAGKAYQALAEHRQAGQVALVGQDAELAACQRIVEGTQTMTVYKPVEEMARQAANYAVALGKGETLEEKESVYNGSYHIPSILLEPVAVTQENMKQVILDSGFHLEGDVYLNRPD